MQPSPLLAGASALAATLAALSLEAPGTRSTPLTAAFADSTPPSSAWLARLPDGEAKRRFILDCTGCHQFDAQVVRPGGRPRTETEWADAVARMLGYAGAKTPFPVISADRDPEATARWLAGALAKAPAPKTATPATGTAGTAGATGATGGTHASGRRAEVREFLFPAAEDLPHDVAIDSAGRLVVTGMFSHRMYLLDTATGRWSDEAIPVDRANPRAVEVDAAGNWWVVLGGPNKVARRDTAGRWETWDVGVYAHSIALDRSGRAWVNGHFTRDPELLVSVQPRGGAGAPVASHELVRHPTLAARDGGPVPYELRAAPDGAIWMSELHGNRIVRFDPATRRSEAFELPTPHSGPRRFDVDAEGVLWIPGYAAGTLVRFDPRTRRFDEIALPVKDAAPYVVRVDQGRGIVWIGTGAADAVLAYRPSAPAGRRFTVHPLPSRGAMIRHMTIDPRTHDVWLAYGASPGRLPARVARLRER